MILLTGSVFTHVVVARFCYGAEGGLELCQSLQLLVHWLLKVMLKSVQHFADSKQQEYLNVLHSAALALHAMTQSSTVNALLYIARSEGSGKTWEFQWFVTLTDSVIACLVCLSNRPHVCLFSTLTAKTFKIVWSLKFAEYKSSVVKIVGLLVQS